MGEVRKFRLKKPRRVQIPKPASFQDGEEYLVLEFDGKDQPVPASFYPETKMVVRIGKEANGNLHAIQLPEGVALSRLRFLGGGKVQANSILEGSPDGLFDRESLDVIGHVDEIYPLGWNDGVWSYNRSRVARIEVQARPLLTVQ